MLFGGLSIGGGLLTLLLASWKKRTGERAAEQIGDGNE